MENSKWHIICIIEVTEKRRGVETRNNVWKKNGQNVSKFDGKYKLKKQAQGI